LQEVGREHFFSFLNKEKEISIFYKKRKKLMAQQNIVCLSDFLLIFFVDDK
jgi:hypothetical protein